MKRPITAPPKHKTEVAPIYSNNGEGADRGVNWMAKLQVFRVAKTVVDDVLAEIEPAAPAAMHESLSSAAHVSTSAETNARDMAAREGRVLYAYACVDDSVVEAKGGIYTGVVGARRSLSKAQAFDDRDAEHIISVSHFDEVLARHPHAFWGWIVKEDVGQDVIVPMRIYLGHLERSMTDAMRRRRISLNGQRPVAHLLPNSVLLQDRVDWPAMLALLRQWLDDHGDLIIPWGATSTSAAGVRRTMFDIPVTAMLYGRGHGDAAQDAVVTHMGFNWDISEGTKTEAELHVRQWPLVRRFLVCIEEHGRLPRRVSERRLYQAMNTQEIANGGFGEVHARSIHEACLQHAREKGLTRRLVRARRQQWAAPLASSLGLSPRLHHLPSLHPPTHPPPHIPLRPPPSPLSALPASPPPPPATTLLVARFARGSRVCGWVVVVSREAT